MGLFSLFSRTFFTSRQTRERLTMAPFSPQRLERRRVLDASAASLLLGSGSVEGDFVQVGDVLAAEPEVAEDSASSATVATNTPPSGVEFLNPPSQVVEGDDYVLTIQFEDPDLGDTHTVEIDWGDGNVDTLTLSNDERMVLAEHRYADDMPSGPSEIAFDVKVKVTDSFQETAEGETQGFGDELCTRHFDFSGRAD